PQLFLGLPDGGTAVVDAGWDTTIASARDPRTVTDTSDNLIADGRPQQAFLVSFDVSQVPPWSTVVTSSLEFHCGDGTVQPYSIYPAARPWVESQATWNEYATGAPWAAPGADGPGDHGSTAVGTLTGVDYLQTPLSPGGAQLVQDWIRGVLPNRGFQVLDYGVGPDGIHCGSREDTDLTERPGLSVTYLEGQLGFPGPPVAGGVGAPLGPFTLERRRLDGVAISAGAPALAALVASTSGTAGFATDAGAAAWTPLLSVGFDAGSLTSGPFWMRDPDAGRPIIVATAGAAWQSGLQAQSVRLVRLGVAPVGPGVAVPVGAQVVVGIQAVDVADVVGPAALSARVLDPGGGTGTAATFAASTIGTPGGAQVSGVAAGGGALVTVTDSRAEAVQVCGSITGAPASERCVPVRFAVPDHLALALAGTSTATPIEGCAKQTLRVQLVDAAGAPIASASQVSLCAPVVAALVMGQSTLSGETRTPGCVIGALAADGSGGVEVTPTMPVWLTFGAASPLVPNGDGILPVQWIPGPPSPRLSTLRPRDTTGPIPLLRGQGSAMVRMVPIDACGFSALARSSLVTLVVPGEVAVGPSQADFDAGALDFPVSLDRCPAPGSGPLDLRARVGPEPFVDGSGIPQAVIITPVWCDPTVTRVGCGCGAGGGASLTLAALLWAARWRRRRSAAAP
ncbi:MAG TPA: DNRLRE domain-containing protein, partial [Myxococcales bacterium]|nr:DNRLRE domain-containing protein [Myxococcales bacterium]